MNRRGLTLVELLVALMVGVIIVFSATTSLSNMLRAKERSAATWSATSRAHATAERIAEDVASCVRDADLGLARLVIADGRQGSWDRDEILLLSRSLEPVRGLDFVGEGPEFEVQHRIQDTERGSEFWRRRDPAFDDYQDAGGIAARVAEGALSLSIEATDGAEWFGAWDSDADGLPYAVRITVIARSDDGRVRATARRLAAIDRLALPPATEETETTTGTGAAR